jgi:Fe-S-cluster-containing dehydrogenase component
MAKQKYLVIDVALCHDCNNCFIACKDEFVMNSWLPYTDEQPRHGPRWMNIERRERGQYPRIDVNFLPKPCQHCADPECAKAFPDLVKKRDDGIVVLDAEKAKGAKGLVDACPYGAIWYNDEKDVAQKCIMCAHILDGEAGASICMPRCAHSCPTGAMEYIEADEAEFAQKAEAEGLKRYKCDVSDGGLVWYKNLYRYTCEFIAGGLLKDGDCAEGVTVSLKGADVPDQVTNYFGDFCFDGLAPGTYTVVVDGKDVKEVTIEESANIGSIDI